MWKLNCKNLFLWNLLCTLFGFKLTLIPLEFFGLLWKEHRSNFKIFLKKRDKEKNFKYFFLSDNLKPYKINELVSSDQG